jgi:polar amino acid transport system substrate-binding protein
VALSFNTLLNGCGRASCAAFLLMTLGAAQTTARAADTDLTKLLPDEIRQSGELHVAANTSYPPFAFQAESGDSAGIEPAIVRAMGQKLGIKVIFTPVEFATVLPSISAGRFELGIAGLWNTVDRQKVVTFINYLYATDGLVVEKGNPDQISTQSLCGKSISSSQGSYQTTNLAALSEVCVKAGKPAIDAQVFQGTPAQLVALRSKRVQASNIDIAVAAYMVQKEPASLERVPGITPNASGQKINMGMIVKKGDDKLVAALQAALDAVITDGTYAKILAQWQIPDEAKLTKASIN